MIEDKYPNLYGYIISILQVMFIISLMVLVATLIVFCAYLLKTLWMIHPILVVVGLTFTSGILAYILHKQDKLRDVFP